MLTQEDDVEISALAARGWTKSATSSEATLDIIEVICHVPLRLGVVGSCRPRQPAQSNAAQRTTTFSVYATCQQALAADRPPVRHPAADDG